MPDKLNIEQFAAKIRERRPDLASVPNSTLVGKVLMGAPELKDYVDLSPEANGAKDVKPVMYPGGNQTAGQVAQDQSAEVLKGAGQAITGLPGALKQLGGAAWDALKGDYGASTNAAKQMASGIAQPFATAGRGLGALAAPQSVAPPTEDAWKQAAQGAGNMLVSSELPNAISGAGSLAAALANKIPSKARAGANFQAVMEAARNVPIDTTEAGNAALRAEQLSKTGSTLPKVLNDFLKYPGDRPLNYEIGRDFASNAGALSASEKLASNPQMLRQVGQFASAMKEANRAAAAEVGMGGLYDSAMAEYAKAANMAEKAAIVKKWAGRAAVAAGLGAAGTAGYNLYEKLSK